MGKLYDIIQGHIDAQKYDVPERQVAKSIGVTQTAMSNWRYPKGLVAKQHLLAISRETGVPYARVLDALLEDIGYLHADSEPIAAEYESGDIAARRNKKRPPRGTNPQRGD
jgi:hypothetical protein